MRKNLKIDWWLLAPVSILVMLSLTILLSINPAYFRSQLISLIVSLIAFFTFSQINTELLKSLRLPIYIISLILLLIVLALGIESRGAVRWVSLFGTTLQFSEILKPFLLVSFASLIAENKTPKLKSFFFILASLLPVFALIYLQPDLGSALIYASVAVLTLFIIGFPLLWFFLALLPLLIASPLIWGVLHEYQRQRILTFLHPKKDPLGSSYNAIQATIAVGSGMILGKGIGQGTQSTLRFLPERQTDFIFATLSEGLGLIGGLLVIAAFGLLCYRIFLIFKNSTDLFEKSFTAGCFFFFLIQFFFNVGMNIGLLPVVGVTLPFVSFGGSSLLASFIFLGILSSLGTDRKYKHVLEIK
jgi:rod shape determining protein RodA